MPSSPLRVVVQQLRAAGRDGAGRTDGELLTQFLSRRDEDALAALVERHAPMVWGVCCRLLRNPHDVEDAFQATFLVLVQKAATVVPREMLGNWLYGVAQRTAVRLRAMAAKRGWREVQMNELPEPAVADARDEELLSLLDQELSRLPERFRALIVLCDLEGHTRKDVARRLGCPEGTVASRLARARELLAKRLTRRGLAVSGGSLAATLSHSVASADVPRTVVTSTINVATLLAAGKAAGVLSGPVAALTQGVLKTMFLKKIMTTAVAVLALGAAVVAAGSLAGGRAEGTGSPKVGNDVKPPAAEKPVDPQAKQEKEAGTAWGREAGGLQAGLGLLPGAKRVYRHGETVTLVVRVRNVGKEAVTFQYVRQFLDENRPTVTDAGGKAVPQAGVLVEGVLHVPVEVALEPGKEIVLETRMHGASGSPHKLLPVGGERRAATKEWPLVVGTGKVGLQYERVLGNSSSGFVKLDPALSKLATGTLELEVKEAPAEQPKPLSPEEATRMKEGSKLTVEFKVESVTKAVLVMSEAKQEGWIAGHGPDDRCLRSEHPKDKVKARFLSILTPNAIGQLNKAGIRDIEKHFSGKTVRVTGSTVRWDYDGYGTAPQVEIVVNDLSQLEVVK